MKDSSRLDVVSASNTAMETAVRNSLKKRFEENTNTLVRKLGEGWSATADGASYGYREGNVGIITSIFNKDKKNLGYRVKLETLNVGSDTNLDNPEDCTSAIAEELSNISRLCIQLSHALSPRTPKVETDTGNSTDICADEE